MEKIDFIKKCADIAEGFSWMQNAGIQNLTIRFKYNQRTETESYQSSFFISILYPFLISKTIETINKGVKSFDLNMHFSIFHNIISILDKDYQFIHSCHNNDGIGLKEKEDILIKYFELLEDDNEG